MVRTYCCIILLCLTIAGRLHASEDIQDTGSPRLAVLEFEKTGEDIDIPDVEKLVNEWLIGFLVNTNTCEIIERQELEKVLQEQSLGQTGILDQESAANVGNILGVDILVTGKILSFETLEVTARLLDATNGAILSVSSVQVEDEDELRDKIKELALLISRKFSQAPADDKDTESASGSYPALPGWYFWFDEEMPERDRQETTIRSQDDIIHITGTYQDNHASRFFGIYPEEPGSHTALETRLKVSEVQGIVTICAGATWTTEEYWAGTCVNVEEDWTDISVYLEDAEHDLDKDFDVQFRRERWYTLRLEYTDNEFVYSWEGKPLHRFRPSQAPRLEDLEFGLDVILEETQHIAVEMKLPQLD